jgi:tRNA dimethylallyltransferase
LAGLPAERSLSRTAREAIGYRELLGYLAGEIATLDSAFDAAVRRTRRFARRQRTWFGGDPRVQWVDGARPRDDLVAAAVRAWHEPRPASAAVS